jgi:dynein heavy chain, axonemal
MKVIADAAQADLDKAMPALEAAQQALETLNKNDITEIKAYKVLVCSAL